MSQRVISTQYHIHVSVVTRDYFHYVQYNMAWVQWLPKWVQQLTLSADQVPCKVAHGMALDWMASYVMPFLDILYPP